MELSIRSEDSVWVYQGACEIWVHKAYGNYKEISQKLNQLVKELPRVLKDPLRYMVARPDTLKSGKGEGAARCLYKEGGVVFFKTTKFQGPWLSKALLEHEYAHPAGAITGPPEKLKLKWRAARLLDQAHQKTLVELPGTVKVERVAQPLSLTSPWINRYAATRTVPRRVREDWAEAITYYLLDQRQGRFTEGFRYQELFPNRKALVESFLA